MSVPQQNPIEESTSSPIGISVQNISSSRQVRRRNSLDASAHLTSLPSSHDEQLALDSTDSSSLSSYAGSDESSSESQLSPIQQLSDIMATVFDPSPLDRVVVLQAQSSGIVHAKTRELQQLQQQAAFRLEELKQTFSQDLKAAKHLIKDLEWTHRRIASAIRKAKLVHPIEYTQALERVKGAL